MGRGMPVLRNFSCEVTAQCPLQLQKTCSQPSGVRYIYLVFLPRLETEDSSHALTVNVGAHLTSDSKLSGGIARTSSASSSLIFCAFSKWISKDVRHSLSKTCTYSLLHDAYRFCKLIRRSRCSMRWHLGHDHPFPKPQCDSISETA